MNPEFARPLRKTAIFTPSAPVALLGDLPISPNTLVKRLVNVVLGFGNMIFSYLGLYLTQYVV